MRREIRKGAWAGAPWLLALASVLRTTPGLAASPAPPPVTVSIDAAVKSAPISPHLYGQFLEHIGPIVNHGLCAEMIDDRKFYGPIFDAEPPAPTDARILRRGRVRDWIRVGPAEAVTLDARDAYVGEHSPRLTLRGTEPVGFRQGGIALLTGKSYDGHIIAAGDSDATVNVSLVWAEGRRTVALPKLSAGYASYALHFDAPLTTDEAHIEVVATGQGAVRIGAISLMPADNIEGFRAEVIAALKQLRSGVYRFPGGNFLSAHEWRDAIGPRDQRPPVFDPVWKFVQPNDVGTDEFLALSRLLGVDPYITTNAGFGDAWSAAQLVEYCNGVESTPMGRQRAANGHPAPYGVKLWGIGNEPWGDWQMGAMPVTQYVWKHNAFARAMRKVDPSVILVAGGAMPDTMTGSKQALRFGKSFIPEPLSPADWTGNLILNSLAYMDQISEHFYAHADTQYDPATGDKLKLDPNEPLIDWMRRPANYVRIKYEEYQDYLERIPVFRARPVPINLDEWAMTGLPQGSYKLVPAYAWVLQEMFRHPDVYQSAAFTFATALLNATRNQAELNPVGLMFKLYREHFGITPVQVSGDRPPPTPSKPPGGDQPKKNAGSDTYPLDVVAAWSEDGAALSIAVINPTESEQRITLNMRGVKVSTGATLWWLAHPDLDYTPTPGKPVAVKVQQQRVAKVGVLTIPRYSVSIYEMRVAR